MTTFPIPKGKIVDRIEVDAGEGEATINIIYKEDNPKPKDMVVLVETEADTWIYRNKSTGNLVHIVGPLPKPENHIPLRQAEAGEFVVFRQDSHSAAMQDLIVIEDSLSILASGDVAVELRQIVNIAMRLRGLRYFLEEQSK